MITSIYSKNQHVKQHRITKLCNWGFLKSFESPPPPAIVACVQHQVDPATLRRFTRLMLCDAACSLSSQELTETILRATSQQLSAFWQKPWRLRFAVFPTRPLTLQRRTQSNHDPLSWSNEQLWWRSASNHYLYSIRIERERERLDDSQLTHLVCVCLKDLLCDCFLFLGGGGGSAFPVVLVPFSFLSLHICGVIICAKFGHFRSYYLGQVCFFENTVCKNNKYGGGGQHFCLEIKVAH